MRRTTERRGRISPIIVIILFVLAAAGIFLLLKYAGSHWFVHRVSYADIEPAEQEVYGKLLADFHPSADLTIKADTAFAKPTAENTLTTNIYVPVTDFYSAENSIGASDFAALVQNYLAAGGQINASSEAIADGEVEIIPLSQLAATQKLLAVDDAYYLDTLDAGAAYRVLVIDGGNNNDWRQISDLLSSQLALVPTSEQILTINQTGVTALTRGMQTKLNQVGDGSYFAAKIKDLLASTDLTHISNEVSFADDCSVDSGSTTLCADPRMLASIEAIGTDIIELTGNHNNDWSQADNLATIELYREKGYQTFGGGADEDSARVPLQIDEKGNKITWLGYNYSTSTQENGQGALGSHPGANIYDEEIAAQQIAEAKARGDFVIVDVQYFECYSYPEEYEEMPECDQPISGQTAFFRHLADLGADLVVGTQAHQPQTYELYQDTPIYYGLGNLFFDQVYWPGTERGLILTHYLRDGKLLQTRVTPTMYDEDLQVATLSEPAATQFLERLKAARP